MKTDIHIVVFQYILLPLGVFAFVDEIHYNVVEFPVVEATIFLRPTDLRTDSKACL